MPLGTFTFGKGPRLIAKTRSEKSAKRRRLKSRNATWAQFPTATPERKKPDVIWPKGENRMVCNEDTETGRELYRLLKHFMHIRDKGLCCICGEFVPLEEATFEHTDLRSGGHRNDQPEYWKNGELIKNGVAHKFCNSEKGSKRVPYLPHATKGTN
jgi:hypothetical protein